MTRIRIFPLVIASFFFANCSGGAKMINPLKGGYVIERPPAGIREHGNWHITTIYPENNYQARATEDGKVISIFEIEGDYAMVIKGKKYYVTYHGFDSCYVQQHAIVKKGQSIGRLAKMEEHGLDLLITDSKGKTLPPDIQVPIRRIK